MCEIQLPETDVAQLDDVTDDIANHRLSGDTPVKKQRSAKKGVSSEPLKNVHEMGVQICSHDRRFTSNDL